MSESINLANLSVKSLVTATKTVEADFPGKPGFKINLTFLSRESLVKIRKKATTQTFKRGVTTEVMNDELFLQLYSQGCIKGWSGLKLAYVASLAPVDLTGQDPTAELAFSDENALFLMQQSSDFDAFISDTVTDLSNFQ